MKTKELFIASKYINPSFELTLSSFFYMMQSIAAEHVEDYGIDKSQTIDKGCTWIVSRVEVDVIENPRFSDTIYLDTYPGEDIKFLFPRYFRIRNKDGKELIRASSIWALLDLKNRTLARAPFEQRLVTEHHDGELAFPRKLLVPSEGDLVEVRKVRVSDTDLNDHLNNVKYIDFITDIHSEEFAKKYRVKHIVINYNREIRLGQEVELYTNNANPEVIWGKVDGQVSFVAELTYEER